MKKIALITAVVCGLAAISYGQGFVNFANASATTPFQTNAVTDIYGNPSGYSNPTTGTGNKKSSGDLYYYTVLFLPYAGTGATNTATASTLIGQGWIWSGIYGSNALASGSISGGTDVATGAGDAIGSANQFIVVGWSASLAGGNGWLTISNDLATASWGTTSGYFGISMTGTGVGAAAPTATPEQLWGLAGTTAITTPLTLFAVPVPEPATMALAGLSGLSLLLFRRRK